MGSKRKKPSDRSVTDKVNLGLMRCQALLANASPDPEEALRHACLALELARGHRRHALEAKAQCFRGHCFAAMGRWRMAYDCYVRCAHVPTKVDAEALTADMLDKMRSCDQKDLAQKLQPSTGDIHQDHEKPAELIHAKILEQDCEPLENSRPQLRRIRGRSLEAYRASFSL